MKSKALAFCLSTLVTIGVLTACKKTTDAAPTPPEPPKPELSPKDPQALSASLKVYHGERLTGNVPTPSGTSLQLEAGEAYIHGFKGGLAVINPQLSSNNAIAGYYMKLEGATEYFKIDYSKPRGARLANKAKHHSPFNRGAQVDSLSDGNVDSALVIVLPPNIKVPDTFCVSYCAYGMQGNVSNVITICIVVNSLGADAEGAWLNGNWNETAVWYNNEPHDSTIYDRWVRYKYGDDYYCEYDSIQNDYHLVNYNNGTTPVISDSSFHKGYPYSFSNNGAMQYNFTEYFTRVNYYNKPCDSISFLPVGMYKFTYSHMWSYNSLTKKIIVVNDYGQKDFEAMEYTINKLNDNHFIWMDKDNYSPNYIVYSRFEK